MEKNFMLNFTDYFMSKNIFNEIRKAILLSRYVSIEETINLIVFENYSSVSTNNWLI